MNSFEPDEFYYRLGWRTRSAHPGSHTTRSPGGSSDFRGYVPFLENPDPMRISLRATLRSVPRKLMSSAYNERAAIAVYAVLDLSASMYFKGNEDKFKLLANITSSIAWSANRCGDAFGLVACDDTVRSDLFEFPSYRNGIAQDIHGKVMNSESDKCAKSSALPVAVDHMRQKRSLVFLISDFHLDNNLLKKTLISLASHDVVPVVLWDSAEYQNLPSWGWARVKDMENGGEMSLFMRPSLSKKIKESYNTRKNELISLCVKYGARTPFFVESTFKADDLTHHLLELS